MKIRQGIRSAVLVAVLGFGTNGSAQTVSLTEVENYSGVGSAQRLTLGGVGSSISISGVIGNNAGAMALDADFFSFDAQKDTVLTFDIENGMGGVRNVDTFLSVFGPGPLYKLLRENDDKVRLTNTDSRIANFTVPGTGIYTVGVSAFPGLNDGGTYRRTTLGGASNGDYTLIITVVSLPVQVISIEIKPGSGERAPINPKAKGNVPVALLGSDTFNALSVDPASLTFGATGNEKSWLRCGKDGVDVNGDSYPDLVCHFENQAAGFARGDLEGIVKGKTRDGTSIEGHGILKVVPEKAENI